MFSWGAATRVVAPLSAVAAKGYKVRLMRVDFPEPDTPVIQVSKPKGTLRSIPLRLLPEAPFNSSQPAAEGGCRWLGRAILRCPVRN